MSKSEIYENKIICNIIPMSNLSVLKKFFPNELCYKIMKYASPINVANINDTKLKLTNKEEINYNFRYLKTIKGKGYNYLYGFYEANHIKDMNERLYQTFKSMRMFPNNTDFNTINYGLTYGIIEDFCIHNNIKYFKTQTDKYQYRNLKNLYEKLFPNFC